MSSSSNASPSKPSPDESGPASGEDITPSRGKKPSHQFCVCPFNRIRLVGGTDAPRCPGTFKGVGPLKVHLRRIRIVGEDRREIGFDAYHLPDDPLWQSVQVQYFLHVGHKRRDDRTKRYGRPLLSSRTNENTNELSPSTTKEEMRDAIDSCSDAHLNFLSQVIATFGLPPDPTVNPLPLCFPLSPSIEAYLQFVLLLTPLDDVVKITEPESVEIQRKLKLSISTYKSDLLGSYSEEQIKTISETLYKSCDLVEIFRMDSHESQVLALFRREWMMKRNEFVYAHTRHSPKPSFVFLQFLASVYKSYHELRSKLPNNGIDSIRDL